MQTFTRVYGKVAYLGTISDFSTSLRFLFYELISRFQNLISVISPRAYEISPSVGPLGLSLKFPFSSLEPFIISRYVLIYSSYRMLTK